MSRSASRVLLSMLALIVASCGGVGDGAALPRSDDPQPTTTSTSPHGDLPESGPNQLDIIVLPDDSGDYPAELIVACASGPDFPFGALEDVRPIPQSDPDGMLAAIAPFLESEEGQFWPQENWHLLHEEEEQATLATLNQDRVTFMFLQRDGDEWTWSGSSSEGDPCDLQYTVPEGLNTVDWRLDPNFPTPASEADQIHVLLTERECVSGQEIGDRLLGPQLVMTDTSVLIAFAAEPPPGDAFNCQGNPETPYTVQLMEPLGDREIVEGMSIGLRLEDFLR